MTTAPSWGRAPRASMGDRGGFVLSSRGLRRTIGVGRREPIVLSAVVLILCALLAVGAVLNFERPPMSQFDEIEYRGQKFKLAKSYSDYDDYKEDPDNIEPSERARVERLVCEAKVAQTYLSRDSMVRDVFGLRFPGYGLTSFGEKAQADDSVLAGFGIEIPQANKERILVFRGGDGGFRLIDDFVASSELAIMGVGEVDGKLIYNSREGERLLTRSITER